MGRLVRGMEMEFPSGIYNEGVDFLVGKYPVGYRGNCLAENLGNDSIRYAFHCGLTLGPRWDTL